MREENIVKVTVHQSLVDDKEVFKIHCLKTYGYGLFVSHLEDSIKTIFTDAITGQHSVGDTGVEYILTVKIPIKSSNKTEVIKILKNRKESISILKRIDFENSDSQITL